MFWLHSCLPWHALSPGLVVLLLLALLIPQLGCNTRVLAACYIVCVVHPGRSFTGRKGSDTRRTIEEQRLQHLNPLVATVQHPPQCLATG